MAEFNKIIDDPTLNWDQRVEGVAALVEAFPISDFPSYLDRMTVTVTYGIPDPYGNIHDKSESVIELGQSGIINAEKVTEYAGKLRENMIGGIPKVAGIELCLDYPPIEENTITKEQLVRAGIPEEILWSSIWVFPREKFTFQYVDSGSGSGRVEFHPEQLVAIGHPAGRSGVTDVIISRKGDLFGSEPGSFPLISSEEPGNIIVRPYSDTPVDSDFANPQGVFDLVTQIHLKFGVRF